MALRSFGVLRGVLAVPRHAQVEALQAWPIIGMRAEAWHERRCRHLGRAAEDVVTSIKAEIIAEPKLAAAQPEMKIVAARGADPSAGTKSKGAAACAKTHICVATAWAETHAPVIPATAKAVAHASIAAGRARAETHASVTAAAAAHAAAANTASAPCLSRGRNRQG